MTTDTLFKILWIKYSFPHRDRQLSMKTPLFLSSLLYNNRLNMCLYADQASTNRTKPDCEGFSKIP